MQICSKTALNIKKLASSIVLLRITKNPHPAAASGSLLSCLDANGSEASFTPKRWTSITRLPYSKCLSLTARAGYSFKEWRSLITLPSQWGITRVPSYSEGSLIIIAWSVLFFFFIPIHRLPHAVFLANLTQQEPYLSSTNHIYANNLRTADSFAAISAIYSVQCSS